MKRLLRWMIGFAIFFLVIGVGFILAGIGLGATLGEAEFLTDMGSRVLHMKDFSMVDSYLKGEEDLELSDILEEKKSIEDEYEEYQGKLTTEKRTEGNLYELSKVKNLEIDLKAGELCMKAYQGDEIQVKIAREDRNYVKVSSGDDFLRIEGMKKIQKGTIIVYYPENLKLEQLKVEVDAGEIEIENTIQTNFLDISIGAGELQVDGPVYTQSAMIEVGAGEVEISYISSDSLEGNCGVGSMTLGLEGYEEDYNYNLECGLGEIQIGDNMHSSIGDHQEIDHGNKNKNISLSCGMGEIVLTFWQ